MPIPWEEKAYNTLHHFILKYTKGTTIPPEWVAGLIYCECGRLDPKASRFEQHVFNSVMHVKKGNKSTAFPGFNSGKLYNFIMKTNDVTLLKSMASSWGLGQLMGYHFIDKWSLPPDQYMNQSYENSVKYLIEFMKIGMRFTRPTFEKAGKTYTPYNQLMRWHNTGSITGATFHPDYPDKAQKMSELYKKHMTKLERLAQANSHQVEL